ncbi:tail fiber domain-containing protein [bacterium]|nr:tail fiber domain-containing protein [bacterium]
MAFKVLNNVVITNTSDVTNTTIDTTNVLDGVIVVSDGTNSTSINRGQTLTFSGTSATSVTESNGVISIDASGEVPTNISAFVNDVGYITSETDNQTLSFVSPDLTISNGNSVDLSALQTDLTGYATEAYVDQAEADAISSANIYTDFRDATLIGDSTVNGTIGNTIKNRIDEAEADAITSANAYTDTAELDAITASNAYTDTRETAITSAYQAYADTAELDAIATSNSYTDAAVSSGTGSLTTDDIPEASNLYYTDLRVQTYLTDNNYTTEAYVDQAEADAIATSTTFALSAANAAEADANTYTDTRETAITSAYQTYTDTAEADAIATSTTFALSAANAAKADAVAAAEAKDVIRASDAVLYADQVETNANTYTDTQVTKPVIDALNIQAASVDTNSVALGTDTTGNYVAGVSGTLNEIEVSGSGSETSSVTVGLPSNVSVTNDLTVGGDLFVTGTTVSIGAANLSVDDSFIYLNQGDAIGADNTTFTGTGLDDASFEGYFEGTTTTTYYVRIDSTGATDTFEWSKDNFTTTEATGIAITGGEQDLDNNIKFHASATTGHTLGDVWSGTAAPLAIDTGIFSNINSGTAAPGYTHVGVFYDASATRWKVFSEYDPEPNGDINTGDASFVLGAMEADCFIAREVDITSAPTAGSHATTKTYVDGIKTALELYADNGDTASIATANSYTDSQLVTQQTQIDSKLPASHDMSLTLNGDVSGTATFTNMANATLTVVVADDSHNHVIANVDGLQTALNAKVDDSQVLTNVPSGALFTDTVYTHPTSHPISFITGLQTALNNKVDDSQVLTNVPAGAVFTDTNTQRAIHDTPVNGATTTSISSNWAFDNVKTAVPSGAVFTDTNTNNYISGATFSTSNGVLTLERSGLSSLTVDLDGRFTDNVYADNMNQNVRTTDSPSFNTLRATATADVSATSTGHGFQVGVTTGQNIAMDSNEIIARNNGSLATLYLQTDGQNTIFGNNTTDKVQIGSGAIVATGDITAYGTVSDRRQKENIERLENALDKVNQLNGYTFNYLNHEDRMTGVMAQEVQEVLPEAVFETNKLETEDGVDSILAVRHGNMVGLLIEAIKEQQIQIELLKQEVDNLKNKV